MLYKKGYSVIEVLLAGSILALAIAGIVGAMLIAQRNNQSSIAQSQALEMAQEGIVALKSIRDRDYSILINTADTTNNPSGSEFGLSFDDGIWNLIPAPTASQDRLDNPVRTRRVRIENDTTIDAKLVTVTVVYQINPEGDTSSLELSETLLNMSKKPTGVSAESANYRLIEDNLGGLNNSFESITP
ncbi:MAG: type IV pilus modification PilV family protein [Minisyncoccia bacterium]